MRHDASSICVRQTLGSNIKAKREKCGVSQSAFSRMISVDRSYINQIEGGKENITVDILVKICDGLDISIAELWTGLEGDAPRVHAERIIRYRSTRLN